MSDKAMTISVLSAMAIFFIVVATAIDVSDRATNVTFAVLLASAISFLTFQDHKNMKPTRGLLKIISYFMVPAAFLMAAVLVLSPDVPVAVFIPLNAILGGLMYVQIDKSLLSDEREAS